MPTVAQIVIDNPSASRVFERHAIDYCCHGQRPIDQACLEAGVDPDLVRTELADSAAGEELVADMADVVPASDVAGLIGQIVASHHRYLRRELPRLAELSAKVVAAHGAAHAEVFAVDETIEELTQDLLPHLLKEEKVLFPLVIELLGAVEPPTMHCGSVGNPIRVMEFEHDRVGALLATLREQTDSYRPPADACPTWRALYAGLAELEADTHLHVHLENNVLFPQVIALEKALASAAN